MSTPFTIRQVLTLDGWRNLATGALDPAPASAFPTPATTGAREATTSTVSSLTTSSDGQVIENTQINGMLTINHHNVTVSDCVARGIVVEANGGGPVPTGVLIEYTEVDMTAVAADAYNAIRLRPSSEVTLDHCYIHEVGRGVAIGTDATITNCYIHANRTWSGAHRQAIICSGPGSGFVISDNTLYSSGAGNSSAISLYGDNGVIDGALIEHNLISTSGGYGIYGGSEAQKPYPEGSNVHIIDNHFSTLYGENGGVFGCITGHPNGVRGNLRSGNVWYETGDPIPGG